MSTNRASKNSILFDKVVEIKEATPTYLLPISSII
jgi:hypothetical protein